MKLVQEFKTFAMKGSVVDMAVGIIISCCRCNYASNRDACRWN